MKPNYGDVTVTVLENFVAVCEINRAPNNFFDQALIADLANAFEAIDQNPGSAHAKDSHTFSMPSAVRSHV